MDNFLCRHAPSEASGQQKASQRAEMFGLGASIADPNAPAPLQPFAHREKCDWEASRTPKVRPESIETRIQIRPNRTFLLQESVFRTQSGCPPSRPWCLGRKQPLSRSNHATTASPRRQTTVPSALSRVFRPRALLRIHERDVAGMEEPLVVGDEIVRLGAREPCK